jgi:hypothetical protein
VLRPLSPTSSPPLSAGTGTGSESTGSESDLSEEEPGNQKSNAQSRDRKVRSQTQSQVREFPHAKPRAAPAKEDDSAENEAPPEPISPNGFPKNKKGDRTTFDVRLDFT